MVACFNAFHEDSSATSASYTNCLGHSWVNAPIFSPVTYKQWAYSILHVSCRSYLLFQSATLLIPVPLERSWHLSISLAYLPAWIIVAIIWHFRIFTGTNVGLVIVIHLLMGLSLASWSFFIAAPFGKSPQLAAVCSTFLAVLLAILAQAYGRASSGAAFIFSIIFPPGFYIFAIRAVAGFEVHQIPTNVLHPDPDNQLRLLPLIIAAIVSTLYSVCCVSDSF